MGDLALVDAHILVDPLISVSEGHYIAETARVRVLKDPRFVDALIHVDPENDALHPPPGHLPMRPVVIDAVCAAFDAAGLSFETVNLHYLSRGFDIEVVLPAFAIDEDQAATSARLAAVDFEALKEKLGARAIRLTRSLRAPVSRGQPH
jgi:hypothetical protein